MTVRPPAVAGRFYPGLEATLRRDVRSYFDEGRGPSDTDIPRAVIAPHAGFVYSGPVAGSAFRLVEPLGARLRRVVVIGPSHHVAFEGVATSAATWFRTPMGDVVVDRDAVAAAERHPMVQQLEEPHRAEHSIETHLPFLQTINPDLAIIPLVTGLCDETALADLLDELWTDDTLVSVSSDLSHFEEYESAQGHDARTCTKIVALDGDIGPRDACGAVAIRGMLAVARSRGLRCEAVDVRNSGDTAGDRDRVVGYGAFGLWRS